MEAVVAQPVLLEPVERVGCVAQRRLDGPHGGAGFTLRRVGIDPAVASNVFVTACTDICGFLSFLGILTLFLRFV